VAQGRLSGGTYEEKGGGGWIEKKATDLGTAGGVHDRGSEQSAEKKKRRTDEEE